MSSAKDPMSNFTSATRAALAVFVLATMLIVVATALILVNRTQTAETVAQRRLIAVSASVAALIDGADIRQRASTESRLARVAEQNDLVGVAVIDRGGQILAASDPVALREIDWSTVVKERENSTSAQKATWGGQSYFLILHPVVSGERVAVLASATAIHAAAQKGGGWIIAGAVLALLLLGGGLVLLSIYSGSRVADRMEVLARKLAGMDRFDESTARTYVNMTRPHLGALADSMDTMVNVLTTCHQRHIESRNQIAALLQINPHYVLLCTLDGHIVDANPAFYAITGLPWEAVRGQLVEALDEVMPLEPLFELARRSLQENSSMSGIEYALVNRDDVRRAVQISLRAVSVDDKPAVIIQATDVANQRNLERQISTFSDALELMVDQRVAQLTAGNSSTQRLLDDAGLVLASFDAGGSTRQWSQTTQDLTGRTVQQVHHFTAFVSVLGLGAAEKQSFSDWFWGSSKKSYPMVVQSSKGPPHRILWRRSRGSEENLSEGRTLLGMAFSLENAPAGDGVDGYAPSLASSSFVA